jgi:hypothetical protein
MGATDTEPQEDIGRELAQWLKEVGHRLPAAMRARSHESPEEVLRYLSELAGRPLRTREDITLYLEGLHRERLAAEQAVTRRRIWREAAILTLVVAAYLQFYFWDVFIQIERLPTVVVVALPQKLAPVR